MSLSRRLLMQAMTGAAALRATLRLARAEDYPVRPVRVIVAQAPGSGSDVTTRLIAQWISQRLGQPFVVENKPGAGGNIGTEEGVRSPADGYTILVLVSANTVNATLYKNLSFDLTRDITAVACVFVAPLIMEVNPEFSAKTVPEFIALAKSNPGKMTMASSGIGSASHMAGELFNYMTGIDMVHVPYRGSTPALTDLMAGRVDVMFDVTTSSIPLVKAGRLHPLAVTTSVPVDMLPGVPALAEFVPGYEATPWLGLGVPAGTPDSIVDTLNREVNAALADPVIKARLADLGATVLPGSPAQFKKLIDDDIAKWAKVIAFADVKPE